MPLKKHYAVLGLPQSATPDEIQQAYRRLARKFHPDISRENNAEAHFKDVAQAYAALRSLRPAATHYQHADAWENDDPSMDESAHRQPFGSAGAVSHNALLNLWLTPWVTAWELAWTTLKVSVPAPR